jgi:AraC family transcriptional regulator, regulatory protein of adaptative response / DNA-3-methyladenine glycosylase II
MELDHDICYRALLARDPRFDGRFFTGVTSTGIYCRPVCPAMTPKPENCVFYACAAAAEESGFRACQRCRPESAPGTPAWRGTSVTVDRALRLIGEGALDEAGVEALSARLGVGDRHLRRLFAEQLGASPLSIAQTRRVHLAKQLIETTGLPMIQVAQSAGFPNVRRFNAAVRRSFDRTPTAIRNGATTSKPGARNGTITLRLAYRAPMAWDGLLEFFRPRLIPGVETVTGACYRRSVEIDDFTGVVAVEQAPGSANALLLTAPVAAAAHLGSITARLRSVFDLDADPAAVCEDLGRDPRLKELLVRFPGVRVPGAWDRFEVSIRAILGQQVTVAGASRLAGRLVERFGRPLPEGDDATNQPIRLFPRRSDLAALDVTDIAAVGMPAARAATILELARAVRDEPSVLELAQDLNEAVARLTALPGIGDWTAHYIAMRALGEPDAFPAGDLGLRKAMAEGETLPTVIQLRKQAEAWRPWRAYAALLLWRGLSAPKRKESS